MNNNIIIFGFGVIGTEILYEIVKKNRSKKLNINIVEKDFLNFPGGVAYSEKNSKFGFFNNPLRLSNNEFKSWVKNKNNQKKIISYFNSKKNLNLKKWLNKNSSRNFKKFVNLNEIYLPRLTYSLYLSDKFKKTVKILKDKRFIKVNFFQGELKSIKKLALKNQYLCKIKNLEKKNIFLKDNSVIKKIQKKNINLKVNKYLKGDSVILGLGIIPPKNVNKNRNFISKNYIHDFYDEGSTNNLLNKINEKKKLKFINLIFIGNKAGLLETVQELENTEKKISKKLKILSISPSSLTLEKAELTRNYHSYKFKFLTESKISKIKKSDEILSLIKNEFKYGIKKKYNKYDVWTLILKKKILDKCIKKLNEYEKKVYNNKIFSKLRNLTRYTYPETVEAKLRLEKKGMLKNIKDKVIMIKKFRNKILIKTLSNKSYLADIVVNVSGPVALSKISSEADYIKSLKKISNDFNDRGFVSDKFSQISDKIYAPGTLSSNFNTERKTIIKSITENCKRSATHIIKNLL